MDSPLWVIAWNILIVVGVIWLCVVLPLQNHRLKKRLKECLTQDQQWLQHQVEQLAKVCAEHQTIMQDTERLKEEYRKIIDDVTVAKNMDELRKSAAQWAKISNGHE